LCSTASAVAGGPLGANGEPIATSRYSVDFFEGPVQSGARVVGLGGAYIAVAEDVDGNLLNPAAPAVRAFYSTDHFDFALGLSAAFPADFENMDFFNSGSTTAVGSARDGYVFATPALNLQWGSFGLGVTASLQNYAVESDGQAQPSDQAALDIVVNTLHLQAANAFWDGQLIVGVGTRTLAQSVEAETDQVTRNIFTTTGTGTQVGVLYRPNWQPFRLGFALRQAVQTTPEFSKDLLPDAQGDITIPRGDGVMYLPESVSTPWDIHVGAAVQLGRPFNPRWRSSEDLAERAILHYRMRELDREEERQRRLALARSEAEREAINEELDAAQRADDELRAKAIDNGRRLIRAQNASMPQRYLLLSAALLISGPAKEAVGVDSFLAQEVNRSGEKVVYSPRLGAESEVWPGLVKLRAGTYLEPSRFRTSSARVHGTFGFDVRLLRWNVFGLWPDDYLWRISASADAAERYLIWGLSIGGWYPRWAPSPF